MNVKKIKLLPQATAESDMLAIGHSGTIAEFSEVVPVDMLDRVAFN